MIAAGRTVNQSAAPWGVRRTGRRRPRPIIAAIGRAAVVSAVLAAAAAVEVVGARAAADLYLWIGG